MTLRLLTEQYLEFLSLKGGCTHSSESTLVKIQHYWKSHVAAEMCIYSDLLQFHHLFPFSINWLACVFAQGHLSLCNSPLLFAGVFLLPTSLNSHTAFVMSLRASEQMLSHVVEWSSTVWVVVRITKVTGYWSLGVTCSIQRI